MAITNAAIRTLIAKIDTEYNAGDRIAVETFDNILIGMGLLNDDADPNERDTSAWGARVYTRNRIRQKFNREAQAWSPPLQLLIYTHGSKESLGDMKLVRHDEHAITRASDRAHGAVTYFEGAAAEAKSLMKKYAEVIDPVAQRLLEETATLCEVELLKQKAMRDFIGGRVNKAREMLGLPQF